MAHGRCCRCGRVRNRPVSSLQPTARSLQPRHGPVLNRAGVHFTSPYLASHVDAGDGERERERVDVGDGVRYVYGTVPTVGRYLG